MISLTSSGEQPGASFGFCSVRRLPEYTPALSYWGRYSTMRSSVPMSRTHLLMPRPHGYFARTRGLKAYSMAYSELGGVETRRATRLTAATASHYSPQTGHETF